MIKCYLIKARIDVFVLMPPVQTILDMKVLFCTQVLGQLITQLRNLRFLKCR